MSREELERFVTDKHRAAVADFFAERAEDGDGLDDAPDPQPNTAQAAAWLAARIAFADAELAVPELPGNDCPTTHISALIRIRPAVGIFRPYGDADIHVDQLRALLAERDELLVENKRLRDERDEARQQMRKFDKLALDWRERAWTLEAERDEAVAYAASLTGAVKGASDFSDAMRRIREVSATSAEASAAVASAIAAMGAGRADAADFSQQRPELPQ